MAATRANVVVGVIRNFTSRYPEGMARVLLLGDPSRDLGALAEPECRRILAALDLAREMGAPVEWFALSGGARIALDSGTESMDWIARVLRRLVEFTQAGGEVNMVVAGINAGAQPYWNAEATMLMHTRGILIMTPEGAMVLTGKRVLDATGGVSAEDNLGIGGYGGSWAPTARRSTSPAISPRPARSCSATTSTPTRRRASASRAARSPRSPRPRRPRLSPGGAFRTVGEIFSDATNPGAQEAVRDPPRPRRRRRPGPAAAGALVRHARRRDRRGLGRPSRRPSGLPAGFRIQAAAPAGLGAGLRAGPVDGGTLFPLAAKKLARAINAASGNRPLVVLANLSGFDGSPESMRHCQLEYGAEIGRAMVNFRGPIVFCVISRYHGGAFVVFSQALNDDMEVAALAGPMPR